MVINWKRLREALAIVDGEPDKRLNLDVVVDDKDGWAEEPPKPAACGTVGCAMGWIGLHPKFRRLGVKSINRGSLTIDGLSTDYTGAAKYLFGLDYFEARALFSVPGQSQHDPADYALKSHREVLRHRVRCFFAERKQPINTAY